MFYDLRYVRKIKLSQITGKPITQILLCYLRENRKCSYEHSGSRKIQLVIFYYFNMLISVLIPSFYHILPTLHHYEK